MLTFSLAGLFPQWQMTQLQPKQFDEESPTIASSRRRASAVDFCVFFGGVG